MPKHPGAPTSRRPHRSPSRHSKASEIPLSGLGSPTQFHRLHTARAGQHRDADPPMLRPRFVPLQRLVNREEPLSSGGIPAHRSCCVRRVSHPLDALLPPRPAGLVSSRFRSWGYPSRLVPHAVPYALSSAGPLRFLAMSLRTPSPLQGSKHTAQILPAGLGFSQVTTSLPPWVWPFRGFLP